jgi:protein-serine/threonine kinase
MTVPLKPPQLRGVPSTPALRSSTRLSRLPLTRKSESNLRNSKIIPAAPSPVNIISPRRAVYEDLLGSTPGVVRKGDGWSSHPSGRAMAKPSSMASLRERAIAFLRDDREPKESKETGRHIVDLAAEVSTKRIPARPGTPGAGSTLNASQGQGKKKGFFGRLKEMVAGRHKGTEGL